MNLGNRPATPIKVHTNQQLTNPRVLAGYLTGLTIEAFIARLQAAQVKTVVDVRELPLSRKKGFSKTAFCTALSAHGIAYLHAPALGCPKPIRNQYKADGNWQTYTREFLKYIQTQDADYSSCDRIVSTKTMSISAT
jgi:uncharacterized protein (DUF488 family)